MCRWYCVMMALAVCSCNFQAKPRQTMGTNNETLHIHTQKIGPSEKGANWKRIFVLNFPSDNYIFMIIIA